MKTNKLFAYSTPRVRLDDTIAGSCTEGGNDYMGCQVGYLDDDTDTHSQQNLIHVRN